MVKLNASRWWPLVTLSMLGISQVASGQIDYVDAADGLRGDLRLIPEQPLPAANSTLRDPVPVGVLSAAKPASPETAASAEDRSAPLLDVTQLPLLPSNPGIESAASAALAQKTADASRVRASWPAALTAMLPGFAESAPAALAVSSIVTPRSVVRLNALIGQKGKGSVDLVRLSAIFPPAQNGFFRDNAADIDALTVTETRRGK